MNIEVKLGPLYDHLIETLYTDNFLKALPPYRVSLYMTEFRRENNILQTLFKSYVFKFKTLNTNFLPEFKYESKVLNVNKRYSDILYLIKCLKTELPGICIIEPPAKTHLLKLFSKFDTEMSRDLVLPFLLNLLLMNERIATSESMTDFIMKNDNLKDKNKIIQKPLWSKIKTAIWSNKEITEKIFGVKPSIEHLFVRRQADIETLKHRLQLMINDTEKIKNKTKIFISIEKHNNRLFRENTKICENMHTDFNSFYKNTSIELVGILPNMQNWLSKIYKRALFINTINVFLLEVY